MTTRVTMGEALSAIFFEEPMWAYHYYRSVSAAIDKYGEQVVPEYNEYFIACFGNYQANGSKWTFEECELVTMKQMKELTGEVQ
jgi:hypothetical protein